MIRIKGNICSCCSEFYLKRSALEKYLTDVNLFLVNWCKLLKENLCEYLGLPVGAGAV